MRRWNNQKGFTLTELFVVITIMAILASVAIPVFGNLMPGIRLREGAQEVFRILQLAKLEAVKRNKKVFIEFPSDSGNCASGQAQPTADIEYAIYFLDPSSKKWKDTEDANSTTITKGFLPPGVSLCEAKTESTLWGQSQNENEKNKDVIMAAFKSDGLPGVKPGNGLKNGSVRLSNSKGRTVDVVLAVNGGIRIENRK